MDAEGRGQREMLRLQAAALFAADIPAERVANSCGRRSARPTAGRRPRQPEARAHWSAKGRWGRLAG